MYFRGCCINKVEHRNAFRIEIFLCGCARVRFSDYYIFYLYIFVSPLTLRLLCRCAPTRANSHLPLVTLSALKTYQVAIEVLFVRQASHLNARRMERARAHYFELSNNTLLRARPRINHTWNAETFAKFVQLKHSAKTPWHTKLMSDLNQEKVSAML